MKLDKPKPELQAFFDTEGEKLMRQFFRLVIMADEKAKAYGVKLEAEDIARLMTNWLIEIKASEGKTHNPVTDEKRRRNRRDYVRRKGEGA